MSYASKPKEIRHPQAALLAETYVCQRVQSLGYSADLNSERVYQLTDPTVVEVVDSEPTVSLTIDSNEFGSINLYNVLANQFPTGTDTTWHNTNNNDGTVCHGQFEEVATDFLVSVKESKSATTSTRALWFNNCFIDSISGTYQVDGFASESVSLTGSGQSWFLHDYAGAQVGRASVVTGGSGHLDVTHGGDGSVVIVTEDGIRLSNNYWGCPMSQVDITAEDGYNFNSASRYRYIYIPDTNTFPSMIDTPSEAGNKIGGIREGEVELIMWDDGIDTEPSVGVSGSSLSKVLRVQSVDYELSFDTEDLKQLYTGTYHKGLNETNITATITVLDADLEMWARTIGYIADWTIADPTVNEYSLSTFQNNSDIAMRIDVFKSKDYLAHAVGTLLKSITFYGGKITSISESKDVPGRGSQTLELEFTRMHFTGTGLAGRL